MPVTRTTRVIKHPQAIVDPKTGRTTVSMVHWMEEVDRLVFDRNSPLAIAEENQVTLAQQIAINAATLDTANTTISQVNDDLTVLASNLSTLATTVADHIALTSAHGAIGNIVGDGNIATIVQTGVMLQAAMQANSTATTVAQTVSDLNDLIDKLRAAGVVA